MLAKKLLNIINVLRRRGILAISIFKIIIFVIYFSYVNSFSSRVFKVPLILYNLKEIEHSCIPWIDFFSGIYGTDTYVEHSGNDSV